MIRKQTNAGIWNVQQRQVLERATASDVAQLNAKPITFLSPVRPSYARSPGAVFSDFVIAMRTVSDSFPSRPLHFELPKAKLRLSEG